MNLRSVKENKNHSKGRKVQAFSPNKENLKSISITKSKHYEVENGTTKVKKCKIFKRIENEKTPNQKKNQSKNANEETEKLIREPESDGRDKNLAHNNADGTSSTTYTYAEKSGKSTCHKLEFQENPKQILERRLEDLFLKKPSQNFIQKNDFAVDQWYIYEEFLHPLILSPSGDNEIEKNKLIQRHLKNPSTQNYKTDSCKTFQFLRNGTAKRNYLEFDSMNVERRPSNKITDHVNFLKKRKISSCKKVYESVLIFHDSISKPHHFKVYNDTDTGFDNRYNQILKTMEIDNDIDTDEEQLNLAKNFTLDNIKETIRSFSIKQLKNKIIFKRSRTARPGRRTRL